MSRGRLLVTGAAGRVGSHLVPGLRELGWAVEATDRTDGAGIVSADCHDVARMSELARGCRGIVHLAGSPGFMTDWADLAHANIDGTLAMLEAARLSGVPRFVHASSIHTVGGHDVRAAFTPDLCDLPSGLYGVTKIASEALVRAYTLKCALTGIAVRICTHAEAPRNARELKTWLAPADLVALVDRALLADIAGFRRIWGISANDRATVNDPAAREIGYAPRFNAETHARRLEKAGVDTSGVGQWHTLGGRQTDEFELPQAFRQS
ncbi:NAD-dependent epimerase/dehydratase family protein [Oceaniglobus trochenteri]|uniref:NAD-dependent epimerase/dehydratase family protein n=1 Tax=Oceaniglobus trochenteri TaxID=2763260 RepID=UPI001CFF9B07|nr:NAD(P)-dependent oxidoreductase [Oceaniglobus trochenteri]